MTSAKGLLVIKSPFENDDDAVQTTKTLTINMDDDTFSIKETGEKGVLLSQKGNKAAEAVFHNTQYGTWADFLLYMGQKLDQERFSFLLLEGSLQLCYHEANGTVRRCRFKVICQ